jgi:hypothetical protein
MEEKNLKSHRAAYRERLAERMAKAKLEVSHKSENAFLRGFSEGLTMPLSLSIPEIKRERLKPLRVKKTVSGGFASDWAKLNGDMRRAMERVVRIVGQI